MISDRLETANLSLRPFSIEDDSAVLEYWRSDPAWERYNASVPANFSLDDAREFLRKMRARSRATSPSWAIVHQGRVVGVVSITFEQDHRIAVIGYGVHGDLRGKGLSVEAVSKIINEAFVHYPDLTKIRAHTDVENTPSTRVLEKLGFSHEGTLQLTIASQLAALRTLGPLPGGLVRLGRSIVVSASVAVDLTTDRRGRSVQCRSDRSYGPACYEASGNLFSFCECECSRRTFSLRRPNAACLLNNPLYRGMLSVEQLGYRCERITLLPAIPHQSLVSFCVEDPFSILHLQHPLPWSGI